MRAKGEAEDEHHHEGDHRPDQALTQLDEMFDERRAGRFDLVLVHMRRHVLLSSLAVALAAVLADFDPAAFAAPDLLPADLEAADFPGSGT